MCCMYIYNISCSFFKKSVSKLWKRAPCIPRAEFAGAFVGCQARAPPQMAQWGSRRLHRMEPGRREDEDSADEVQWKEKLYQ